MNLPDAVIFVATVKSSKLDRDGCIEVEINRVGKYKAVLAAVTAGDQRGFAFLPDAGDQVLVAAIAGANVQWAVLGSIWSQKDAPPESNADGKNQIQLIRTRGGNEIRLSDENGKERIEIVNKSGKNKITMKADGGVDIESQGDITISGKNIKLVGDVVRVTEHSGSAGKLVVGSASTPNTTILPNKIEGH